MVTFYRRRLPHWQPPGQSVFITWRLHGSAQNQCPLAIETISAGEAFVRYDHFLDTARTGALWLKDTRIAEIVFSAIRSAASCKIFDVEAYVLMANHVHLLIDPHSPLPKITHQIKGASSRAANVILGRTGSRFWQDESFDRWVRTPREWQRIRAYIENNPVKAGLVAKPEDWPWSSASRPIKPATS